MHSAHRTHKTPAGSPEGIAAVTLPHCSHSQISIKTAVLVYTFYFISVGGSKIPFGRKSFPCLLSSFTFEAQILFVTSIWYPTSEDWLNWSCPLRGGLVSRSDISHGWTSFWNTSTFFSYQAPCFCHCRCLCRSTGEEHGKKKSNPCTNSSFGAGKRRKTKPNQTETTQNKVIGNSNFALCPHR